MDIRYGFAFLTTILVVGCAPQGASTVGGELSASGSHQDETVQTPVDAEVANLWTGTGNDWPGFLGAGRDGKSAETGLNWDWTNGKLPLVWSRPLIGGYGIGSTAAGRFFQLDGNGQEARLDCLNAETGKQLWSFDYATAYEDMYGFDNGPRCSPIVDGNRVYIFGVEGKLHCLNAMTGETVWMVDTAVQFGVMQNFFGVGSSPVVHGDLLIVMVGGSPKESADLPGGRLEEVKPNGSAIVAFDKMTGEVRYKTIDDLASYAAPVIATIGDEPAGLAFCRSGLFAFDPGTGAERWSFPWRARKFESVNASTPVVIGDRILITESYGPGGVLLDLSGDKPVPVWQDENIRNQRLSCHWCTPIVVDDFAYGCHGEHVNGAELRCVGLATGTIQWSEAGFGRCTMTYADGHLVCLADSGSMFVIRADSSRLDLVAEYNPPNRESAFSAPCYAAPVISHGLLYVRDARRLFCFDLRKE